MHILIIDNDPLYSWIVKKFIKNEDPKIQVTTCSNANMALHKIIRTALAPDLIILDWDMPGMDGYTFAYEYGQVQTGHIPVIVLTNSIYKRDYDQAKTLPVIKGYFVKPVNEQIIRDMLSYALAEKN